MGAREVLCIDIDFGVLRIARDFIRGKGYAMLEAINADVRYLGLKHVDTVIMNPPFGVHRRGADMLFLRKALELRPNAVYTIHKYSPESHKLICEIVYGSGYNIIDMSVKFMHIHATHPLHRKRVHKFRVAIYAISRGVGQ